MILKAISCTTGSKKQRWFTSQSNQLILAPPRTLYLWFLSRIFDLAFNGAAENIYHLQRLSFQVWGTWLQVRVFLPFLQRWKDVAGALNAATLSPALFTMTILLFESATLQWTQPWLEAHVIPSCTSLDYCVYQWQDIDHGSIAVFQEHVNHSDTNGCFF